MEVRGVEVAEEGPPSVKERGSDDEDLRDKWD